MKTNLPKIITLNILIFSFFSIFIELFFGSWFNSRRSIAGFPSGRANKNIKVEASEIYNTKYPYFIDYKTDEYGYRSHLNDNSKNIYLTIGGSTTHQKFIKEGETWQDYLDFNFDDNIDFINAGLDGRSSLSHISEIKKWHSRYLDKKKVRNIIFYLGVNDIYLLKKNVPNYDSIGATGMTGDILKVKFLNFKNFLWEKSFFYNRIRTLKDKFHYLKDDLVPHTNAHGKKYDFTEGKLFDIDSFEKNTYYKSVFKRLIYETIDNFPKSIITIVQQQIPGCEFIDQKKVIDKHKETGICKSLYKVYFNQDEVIKEMNQENNNIYVLKMYQENIITTSGVYDSIHTNPLGSTQIGIYLKENLYK